MRWRVTVGVLLGALVVSSAGCGGGDARPATTPGQPAESVRSPASPTTAAVPSKGLLIAKADAICTRLNREIARALPRKVTLDKVGKFAPIDAALEHKALGRLGRLHAPSILAGDWRQMLQYGRELERKLVELGERAKANDPSAFARLGESKKALHEKLRSIATRDGFNACSQFGRAQ
jgi:hypothetical protein